MSWKTFRWHFCVDNVCTVLAHIIARMYGQMWTYSATEAYPECWHVIQHLLPSLPASYKLQRLKSRHTRGVVWCAMATGLAASRRPVWWCLGFRFTGPAELNLMRFLIFLYWNKIVAESFTNQRNLRENTGRIGKRQNGNECRSASWHLGDYKWITAE